MMLNEVTPVPEAALPLAEFKAHLRLGTGFGEGSLQDGVLAGFLRAAIAAIEARTGKILIERDFSITLTRWRNMAAEALPLVPVTSVSALVLADAAGGEVTAEPAAYRLEQDSQCPRLAAAGACLPAIPAGGTVRLEVAAGMAADWGSLPADLGQAVLLLAAHFYEYRDETSLSRGCMPFGVTSLIERYRVMRLAIGAVQ